MRVGGLLLAGGRSRRFGSEKAVAPWGDAVMMDGPVAALGNCAAIAVSVRAGSRTQAHARILGLDCLLDDPGDAEGPLAGIRRGLIWAGGQSLDWLALAPCDAPTLTPDHYRVLIAAAERAGTATVAQSDIGLEPLISIWPVASGLNAVEAVLRGGRHPAIRHVLGLIGASPVRLAAYDGLNINVPGDVIAGPR